MARALIAHEVVIHWPRAARGAGGRESFPSGQCRGNAPAAWARSPAGVKRFVHGSTIGVYGAASGRVLDEESKLAPDNPYGRTKAVAETVVRGFEGPMENLHRAHFRDLWPRRYAPAETVRGVQTGHYLTLAPVKNEHQLIYVDDLVQGLSPPVDAPGASGETIVLAGSERSGRPMRWSARSARRLAARRVFHATMWPFVAAASCWNRR